MIDNYSSEELKKLSTDRIRKFLDNTRTQEVFFCTKNSLIGLYFIVSWTGDLEIQGVAKSLKTGEASPLKQKEIFKIFRSKRPRIYPNCKKGNWYYPLKHPLVKNEFLEFFCDKYRRRNLFIVDDDITPDERSAALNRLLKRRKSTDDYWKVQNVR